MINDDLSKFKQILEENLEISKKIYKNTEKIRKYFFWSRFFKSLKWLIILTSLIAGFIYSKPYLEKLPAIYKELLNSVFQLRSDKMKTSFHFTPRSLK